MTPRPRRSGSVRFDPYYKIQRWRNDVGGAWVDVQRAYPSRDDAEQALPVGVYARIMRISDDGQRVVVWGPGERVL